MFGLEQEFEENLRTSLRAVIAQKPDTNIVERLDELGWFDVVSEAPAAFALLYDELGRAGSSTGLVDQLALNELAPELRESCQAVIYPRPTTVRSRPGRIVNDSIIVDGWILNRPSDDGRLFFSTDDQAGAGEPWIAVAEITAGHQLDIQRMRAFDVQGCWFRVAGTVPRSAVRLTIDDGGRLWRGALDSARRAAACEVIGLSRGLLALAVSHVTARVQFGRPIGSFQAVRHRLADAYAALTASQELVDDAWQRRDSTSTAMAFAYACRAHRDVSAQCLQVCGATGMMWEHDLHRYLRRGYALDAFFGPADTLVRELGGSLCVDA